MRAGLRSLLLFVLAACRAQTPPLPSTEGSVRAASEAAAELLRADPSLVSLRDLARHAEVLERRFQERCQWHGIVFGPRRAHPDDPEPTLFDNGGDAALFTGFALATAVYRFTVTRSDEDCDRVLREVRGLHLLTHVSGTPGVLVRCAIPWEQRARWSYPERWRGRMWPDGAEPRAVRPGPYLDQSPDALPDVLAARGLTLFGESPPATLPRLLFYARTTRDQLTGVLFGLAVAWTELDPDRQGSTPDLRARVAAARSIVAEIARALLDRLVADARERAQPASKCASPPAGLARLDLRIHDHRGAAGTLANDVSGKLKLALLALNVAILDQEAARADGPGRAALEERRDELRRAYDGAWRGFFLLNLDALTNGLARSYFPWNLRCTQTFTLWLLERDPKRRAQLLAHAERAEWSFVRDDENTWFTFQHAVMHGGAAAIPADPAFAAALFNLKALSLRPARSFSSPLHGTESRGRPVPAHLRKPTVEFLWQRDPFTVGGEQDDPRDVSGLDESTGLSFLLPYWLGRAAGLLGSG